MGMIPITFKIEEELLEELDDYVYRLRQKRLFVTRSEIIRKAIVEYLERHSRVPPVTIETRRLKVYKYMLK